MRTWAIRSAIGENRPNIPLEPQLGTGQAASHHYSGEIMTASYSEDGKRKRPGGWPRR